MIALRPFGPIAAILCLCLIQSYCSAQDRSKLQLGKVSPADFVLPSNPIVDSNANAVILSDVGTLHFIGNKMSSFSYVYKRQTRIKILNKKAFDLATVILPLYGTEEDADKLSNIVASTYNLQNGQVVETKLDSKNDLFTDKMKKEYAEAKFTMPAVKEGSIIEYTYTITSYREFNLPSWEFQSEHYPCLWSEYQVNIPQAVMYIFVRQGVHGFAVDKGSTGSDSYKLTAKSDDVNLGLEGHNFIVTSPTAIHRWAMKDVPAFHEEQYLSTPANYIDKIEFQPSKVYDGEEFHDHTNNWKKATEELLQSESFGQPINDENRWLDDLVEKIVPANSDAMEQARAIYYYVNNHFTCTNHYRYHINTSLRDVVKKSSGTVGDINLLLIAMLRKRGLTADPVVLSTRDFGFNLASYPVMSKLNYVIARLKLSSRVYYLDAAHPELGFGQLAGDCYNGHARIISKVDSGSVYFDADSLKEQKTTMVLMLSTDKGLEGSFQSTFGKEESYNLRRQVNQKGEKEYFKNLADSYGDELTIDNTGIDSLQKPEDPIKVHYEFRMNQSSGVSTIYLDPMLFGGLGHNPFKAADRKYPVEMPYAMDDTYIFSMDLPEGYVVDELPKSARVMFNADQGLFEYLIGQEGNNLQLRCRLRLNKAWFASDDYASLRDFFAFVVKKESEQIVLKKK